ncbi:MAG: hypothetical protein ABL995_19485 [Bryobacteraceae bacterium]
MTGVVIRGGGAAVTCSAHLLRKAGVQVSLQLTERPRVPVLMLSDAAVSMMQGVFEEPELFYGAHRITKRIVLWGKDASSKSEEPKVLEHSGIVLSEEKLLRCLGTGTANEASTAKADWSILSTRPLPATATEQRFGTRTASAVKVVLRPEVDSSACWIESLEYGWLFLIPNAVGSGWLLSVGESPKELLPQSRLIRPQIMGLGSQLGEFASHPRIVSPLGGPGWLACGTAAMAFDPICGDGTAHAVREAVLATAVIRSAREGGNVTELLNHYEARLTAGFDRHLKLCLAFYKSGNGGRWWDGEAEALEEGIAWCARRSAEFSEYRYRLNGFELKAAS